MKSAEWIGHREGHLTIIGFVGMQRFRVGRAAIFRFRCDCGTEFQAQKSNIIGRRTHCGCEASDKRRTIPPGGWNHPLYKVWTHMIDRCGNPNNKSFKDYGARGISVCDRWKTGETGLSGLECFSIDMGDRPDGYTIERVNSNGPYTPGNCMWLAKGDQSKNRRTVKLVRIGGRAQTIPDWCTESGISYWTAIRRIARGWPPDKAVLTPVRR